MRAVLIAYAALAIFTVFVTVFAASAPAKSVRVLPKLAWVILCLVATPVGGVLYLVFGRPKPESAANSASMPNRPRPVAPEDDPAFMRDLERRLREEGEGK